MGGPLKPSFGLSGLVIPNAARNPYLTNTLPVRSEAEDIRFSAHGSKNRGIGKEPPEAVLSTAAIIT